MIRTSLAMNLALAFSLAIAPACSDDDDNNSSSDQRDAASPDAGAARDAAQVLDAARDIDATPDPAGLIYVNGRPITGVPVTAKYSTPFSHGNQTLLRTSLSDTPPVGEPLCYFSDPRHIRYHYPKWRSNDPWKKIAQRVVESQQAKLKS